MQKPTLKDQMENSLNSVSSISRGAFIASHLILAAGSTLLIYMQIISNLPESLPIALKVAAAWVAGLVWFKAVEHPLRKLILFAMAYILTPKDERKALTKNLRRTGRASVQVTVMLLAATLGLSLVINPDIAGAVTEEKDSSKEIAQSEKVTGSYDRDVDLLREELATARKADAAAIADAKATAAGWVAAAKLSKGAKMARLAKQGNGWAKKQIAPAVSRATKKGERHVANAKSNATSPAAQKALTDYMATRSAGRDNVAMATAAVVTNRQTEYLNTFSRRNYALLVIVVVAGIVMVSSARLLVLACAETGEQVDSEDGDGIVKVAGRKAKQVNGWLASKLDSAFGDKFAVATVSASPVMSAPMSERRPAENSLSAPIQPKKSAHQSGADSRAPEKVSAKVSAPPPPGLAVPPTVSAGFWVDEAIAYRKRVYGWYKTANNPKKPVSTRNANRAKCDKAFKWFRAQGCTITEKAGGKVSIKFPKL